MCNLPQRSVPTRAVFGTAQRVRTDFIDYRLILRGYLRYVGAECLTFTVTSVLFSLSYQPSNILD